MRIGIDIRKIGKNETGSETVVFELVKNLVKLDQENDYFLYTDKDEPDFLATVEKRLGIKKNDRFKVVPVLPASKMLWTFLSLPWQAKKDSLDVLHVEYITPWMLPGKTKLITTIHDISFERLPGCIKKKDLFFLKFLIPISLKRANKVIAVSEFTRKEILAMYDLKEKKIITVLNGGASESYFKKIPKERLVDFKKSKRITDPFIFYVGTLQPRKNVAFLIESFWEFKKKTKNSKIKNMNDLMLIIGGSQRGHNYDRSIDRILDKIRKEDPKIYKKIRMEGFIENDELPFYFQSAEVFCYPSLYEGFGLPILEAMASGVSVLCPQNELFEEIAGESAVFYNQGDKKDFGVKLGELISSEDLRKERARLGQKRAEDFSWEQTAKKTLGVYKNI